MVILKIGTTYPQNYKKVQTDLTTMAYNTAVSALMILANSFDAEDKITKEDYHCY